MKRILVLSNMYPSKNDPTFGIFVEKFVKEMEHSSLCENTNICVIKGRTNSTIIKLYKYIVFYIKAFFLLLVNKYDLIYVHYITHTSLPIYIVSKFKKINVAYNIHGDDLITTSVLGEYLFKLVKPLLLRSKLIVVPSHFFKFELIKRVPSLNVKNIVISASGGISHNFFSKNNVNVDDLHSLKIGYISRIVQGKGWDTLIDAYDLLRKDNVYVDLEIYGTGDKIDVLKNKLNELGMNQSIYKGSFPQNILVDKYKTFDLFIFPTKLYESLGLVGLEAMANSVPVIGSKIGGLQDYIIDGYNGMFFEAGNSVSLCSRIKDYMNLTVNQRKEMCLNAFKTAKKFESQLVSDKLFSKINDVYNEKNR